MDPRDMIPRTFIFVGVLDSIMICNDLFPLVTTRLSVTNFRPPAQFLIFLGGGGRGQEFLGFGLKTRRSELPGFSVLSVVLDNFAFFRKNSF